VLHLTLGIIRNAVGLIGFLFLWWSGSTLVILFPDRRPFRAS
jgi:hypothetical protein